MTPARMRRLASDYEEVKKNFAGHRNIIVTPIGEEPPEKYHVTYFVNGIYLLPDGSIQCLGRHEVEITLHADYPRYKPICRILTPIWHPNFKDGQICIGDIWGAGESLSDIIVNIGEMIQYKSWNSFSPLSSEAAKWAIENKHMFPVGNAELFYADYTQSVAGGTVKIDSTDGFRFSPDSGTAVLTPPQDTVFTPPQDENDFEITAEELAGIEFVPTAQRMQTIPHGATVGGKKVNFKTILVKGLLWALIGAILGFGISELASRNIGSDAFIADAVGYPYLSEYFEYSEIANDAFDAAYEEYEEYCAANGFNPEDTDIFYEWFMYPPTSSAEANLDSYFEYDGMSEDSLYNSYTYEFYGNSDALGDKIDNIMRLSTAVWSGLIALMIGLLMGIGEGVYYGSKKQAVKYALIGAGISLAMGFVSGYLAQWMYASMLEGDPSDISKALIRGLGWAIMGLGIGLSVGLIKPTGKRILFCCLGGILGAFTGGFLFNYICDIIPDDIVARAVAIIFMGVLIGLGVGLLEQFAKQAWLKVVRGEFEGKEYLVFNGTTSIGNNGSNTIVLFKDRLVGPHHCDIVLEGSKYFIVDCGTPMGTVVNGMRVAKQPLKQGDAIAIGNSVLIFNTK